MLAFIWGMGLAVGVFAALGVATVVAVIIALALGNLTVWTANKLGLL